MRLLALLLLVTCAHAPLGVTSNILTLNVTVAPEFEFVGTQRFILREVADAEQHLFIDRTGTRIVWIQYEQYLPHVNERYEYPREQVVTLGGGEEFDVHVRRYDAPPDAGSDRAKAFELLASKGHRFDPPATRVRFVHVPANDARRELMIIYAERGEHDPAAIIERAKSAVRIYRRPD